MQISWLDARLTRTFMNMANTKLGFRRSVFLVTALSLGFAAEMAGAGVKSNRGSFSGVCEVKGEALVVKLPPPSDQSLLVVCDQVGPMKTVEPRPLSRAEAAKLYSDTLGAAKRDDHEKEWFDKFGIRAATLRKHDSDSDIGAEQLIFAQSENVDDLKSLAASFSGGDSSKVRVATLSSDQDMRKFDSGQLRFFGSACEQNGGTFSSPTDQLLMESLSGEPVKIAGKVVCRCGTQTFSNPVDYSCNSKAKDGARAFIAIEGRDSGTILNSRQAIGTAP
jgi:hypothetical protein